MHCKKVTGYHAEEKECEDPRIFCNKKATWRRHGIGALLPTSMLPEQLLKFMYYFINKDSSKKIRHETGLNQKVVRITSRLMLEAMREKVEQSQCSQIQTRKICQSRLQ